MWSELKELLIGFAAALVALVAIAIFITAGSRSGEQDEETGKNAKNTRPRDLHSPIEDLEARHERSKPVSALAINGPPSISRLFIASRASAPMQEVNEIEVIARRGLRGDRYCEGCGFWSEKDECEITMISQADLDDIERETGINFDNGAHRRNFVARNIAMESLIGKRFQIGDAKFAYERPRPPCLHLQKISEPGVVKALVGRSGICIRCFHSGVVRRGDQIIPITLSLSGFLKKAASSFWEH